VVLIYLSPTVQIDLLHHSAAVFPLKNPAIVTLPLSILAGVAVSLLSPEPAAARGFDAVESQIDTGAAVAPAPAE
jgi:cation/acetate symporter